MKINKSHSNNEVCKFKSLVLEEKVISLALH